MKAKSISIGLIFAVIYLISVGIYKCNKTDCLNLRKDKDKVLKKVQPLKSYEQIIKEPEN